MYSTMVPHTHIRKATGDGLSITREYTRAMWEFYQQIIYGEGGGGVKDI